MAERARVLGGISIAASPLTKSEIYTEFLPILNTRAVELPDNARMIGQLLALERRVSRGSARPIIDHPKKGRDDVINAAAGAVVMIARAKRSVLRQMPGGWDSAADLFTALH